MDSRNILTVNQFEPFWRREDMVSVGSFFGRTIRGAGWARITHSGWPHRLRALLDHVSQSTFRACVTRYHGEHNVARFSCWDRFLSMAFARLGPGTADPAGCQRGRPRNLFWDKSFHVLLQLEVCATPIGGGTD